LKSGHLHWGLAEFYGFMTVMMMVVVLKLH